MILLPNKVSLRYERIREIRDKLYIYDEEQNNLLARRVPLDADIPINTVQDSVLFEIGAFTVCKNGDAILCRYRGTRRICAAFLPHGPLPIDKDLPQRLKKYFSTVYRLDPYAVSFWTALKAFEELVLDTAEFCGCLTDVIRDQEQDRSPLTTDSYQWNTNCEHVAIALPIIILMFRRLSALRGFNFKVIFKESLPCLIFSAKVLFGATPPSQELTDIPEYSALTDISESELIVGARLRQTDEVTEGCENIYKLSVAICPQSIDPRGILRAPDWKQYAKTVIDGIDIELDGKY